MKHKKLTNANSLTRETLNWIDVAVEATKKRRISEEIALKRKTKGSSIEEG